MVKINNIGFGVEQYKNGETIFRAIPDIENCREVKIETKFEGYADIFKTCMAIKYAADYVPFKHIFVKVTNFFMVDKYMLFNSILSIYEVPEDNISIKKSYNAEYSKGERKSNTELVFTGDDSIGEWLMTMIGTPWAGPDLNMLYIPYARMDRVVADKIFAFKYFASIVNEVKATYGKTTTLDPHNNTCNLITNLKFVDLSSIIGKVVAEYHPDIICYPDGGAHEKYAAMFEGFGVPSVYAIKLRNEVKHENIVEYALNTADVETEGKKVLIIDDICSTGSTLIKAASILHDRGASDVAVYVSHCEQSMFNGPLLASGLVSKVFTTNSIKRDRECEMIHVYNITE